MNVSINDVAVIGQTLIKNRDSQRDIYLCETMATDSLIRHVIVKLSRPSAYLYPLILYL